jgi:hypothetical protein
VPSEIGNKFKRLLLNEREFDDTNWNREGDVVESIENVSNDSEETSFNFYFF